MEKVITAKAPAAIGPYVQGIKTGSFLFISGQLPIDPATGEFVSEDIGLQTEQSMKNIRAILEQAGTGLKNIVKTTIFTTDITCFDQINQVYASFFSNNEFPARSVIEVAGLPKGAKLEIEAIAVNDLL
ncbi:RidA family protein [Paenibacillus faecalis]|uniref:RidA family protein n=1 Tax=Paenibacillus faecalis TaxID=2079532 RepID=UPI000D0E6559|nr:RidA family protein [Paenibacillus faecalis]